MRNLTATICLMIAVLLGVTGCAKKTPQELDAESKAAVNSGVRVSMGEHRKELFAAIRNNTPYISLMCPFPFGFLGYFPEKFDWFFEKYGNRPLVEGSKVNINGTLCSVNSWNKVLNPSEQRKMDSNQALAKINQSKTTCIQIGFVPKTNKFADCVLRLMEMQSNKRPQTVIQNNTGDSSAVRALLEEQKKQRQLEGSLELMKRGFEMMSPPKPKLTCKYNSLTKTTVCN